MNTSIRQLLPCDTDAVIAFLRSLADGSLPADATGAQVAQTDRAEVAMNGSSDAALESTEAERHGIADIDYRVSLIASDDAGAILGIALCRTAPKSGELHRLQVKVLPQRSDLVRTLIDKTLLKMHARGIHKCRITLGDDEPHEVWNATRWLDHLHDGEPQAA